MNCAPTCCRTLRWISLFILVLSCSSFTIPSISSHKNEVMYSKKSCLSATSGNNNNNNNNNPLSSVWDMFANFDDVVDDFFYKRMGKGEIFYGKRKYKPSGDVEGKYNGFGLTDKGKIDFVREVKAEMDEERAFRAELAKIQREKEQRNR